MKDFVIGSIALAWVSALFYICYQADRKPEPTQTIQIEVELQHQSVMPMFRSLRKEKKDLTT